MALLLSNPPAIIFINNDLTESVKNTLVRQLRIDQVFSGDEFDDIVENDPSWVVDIKKIHEQRIMVIRDFREHQNRELADVVVFFAHGLVSVEKNNFGPPIKHLPAAKLHWGQLCIFVKKKGPGNIASICCGCGVDVCCTIRRELDELNRRICQTCSCCCNCCSCPQPTYKTLLVPHIPNHRDVRGV